MHYLVTTTTVCVSECVMVEHWCHKHTVRTFIPQHRTTILSKPQCSHSTDMALQHMDTSEEEEERRKSASNVRLIQGGRGLDNGLLRREMGGGEGGGGRGGGGGGEGGGGRGGGGGGAGKENSSQYKISSLW